LRANSLSRDCTHDPPVADHDSEFKTFSRYESSLPRYFDGLTVLGIVAFSLVSVSILENKLGFLLLVFRPLAV